MPPKDDKKPKKAPPSTASKAEHQKFAIEVLADPEYKVKPEGYKDLNDEVHDTDEGG